MSQGDEKLPKHGLDSEELAELAKLGDEDAFTALYDRHYRMIYSLGYQFFANQSDAEDVMQEAFVKAARSLDSFRKESKFSSWLYRIAYNVCVDLFKKKKRRSENTVIGADLSTLATDGSGERNREILAAIQTLSEKERGAVIMSYYQGFNHAEIAKVLGCKEKTVSWYLLEAKKKLKALLS